MKNNTENKTENKTETKNAPKIRKYQTKFNGESKYNFETAEKVDTYLNQPLIIIDGFVREGEFGERLVILAEDMTHTRHTLTSGSQVLVKQFLDEEKEGFPLLIKIISVQSKKGFTYLTFASPEE